jgi:hypothetical protein
MRCQNIWRIAFPRTHNFSRKQNHVVKEERKGVVRFFFIKTPSFSETFGSIILARKYVPKILYEIILNYYYLSVFI